MVAEFVSHAAKPANTERPLMLTRRTIMASAPLAAGLAGAAQAQTAQQPATPATSAPAGGQAPGFYRYKVGEIEVTAIHEGFFTRPLEGFVRNAELADVKKAVAEAFLPEAAFPIPFTSSVLRIGDRTVLIDTGFGDNGPPTTGRWMANFRAAGFDPAQVDTIVISHFHPDHISGIRLKNGTAQFPNAEIMVPEPEWAFWMDDGQQARAEGTVLRYFRNARRIFKGMAGDVRRFTPGAEVAPGIVSIPAYGHTPGHTAFAIYAGGRSMLAMSDTVRNPYLFARHPDWQPIFDMNGAMAVAARRRMLDQAAADRMLVEAYHFPFPACGHIARTAAGYDLVPVEWAPL